MKTYLKRPHEKSLSAVFYSPLDTPQQYPSRVNFRQRVVRPSTREQQRLFSSTSHSSRYPHVHWGKYGIKPLGSSEELSCEQWPHDKKSSKVIIMFIENSVDDYLQGDQISPRLFFASRNQVSACCSKHKSKCQIENQPNLVY